MNCIKGLFLILIICSCSSKQKVLYPRYLEVSLKSFYKDEVFVEIKYLDGIYCPDPQNQKLFLESCKNQTGNMIFSNIDLLNEHVLNLAARHCDGRNVDIVGLNNDREIAGKTPVKCSTYSSGSSSINSFVQTINTSNSGSMTCTGGDDIYTKKKQIIFNCTDN